VSRGTGAAILLGVLALGTAGVASAAPGPMPSPGSGPVSAAALQNGPATIGLTSADDAGLIQAFAVGKGIPVSDIGGIDDPRAAYVSSDNSDWAVANFDPSPSDSLGVSVSFQDGGGGGYFVRSADSGPEAWKLVSLLGLPAGCNGGEVLPPGLVSLWDLNSCGVAVGIVGSPGGTGYQTVAQSGTISNFGSTNGATGLQSDAPAVAIATTPSGQGDWVAAADGGVFTSGDAGFYGSAGDVALNQPVVGMAATPDGRGYWLVASDGGVISYGDAGFYGSTGAIHLNMPIVGMASTPDGRGYWLVASDGGVFAFGDAAFDGSLGNLHLQAPIVGMAADPSGGYWLAAADGGVFAFGGAPFYGSAGDQSLTAPVTGMAASNDGGGYWLADESNGVLAFGDATLFGCPDGASPENVECSNA
jgi:hypothetical protein